MPHEHGHEHGHDHDYEHGHEHQEHPIDEESHEIHYREEPVPAAYETRHPDEPVYLPEHVAGPGSGLWTSIGVMIIFAILVYLLLQFLF
jgi:hypothetical protein